MSEFKNASLEYARQLDSDDPLGGYRDQFHMPKHTDGSDAIYLCGNSLGLQPKKTQDYVQAELAAWQNLAIGGYWKEDTPWLSYNQSLTPHLEKLVGAKPDANEVVAMNTLTVNLHLMMVSFYRPTGDRYKILIEGGAFPSDQYAVKSQLKFHGFDPDDALIELVPREGEDTLRTEDILQVIAQHGDQIALVMIGGVNYYTGQFYDISAVTKAGHDAGCVVGVDLAHAIGNVPLQLHDWNVDFACWCSYKYLNSGPGCVAGAFVHHRHHDGAKDLPRFEGWWGNDVKTRFLMGPDFDPSAGAEGWQMSNFSIFSLAAARASLELFSEAGIEALREKSLKLSAYLYSLLDGLDQTQFKVMTPREPKDRGAQFSIVVHENGRQIFDVLEAQGVVGDWREPDCIRISAVPFYNSFEDVYRFYEIFAQALEANNTQILKSSGGAS